MKKLTIVSVLVLALVIALVIFAFIYIEFSDHMIFNYDVMWGDTFFGEVKIDRYKTEEKIVYKGEADYVNSLDYPEVEEKLLLNKNTLMPSKYTNIVRGARGAEREIVLEQDHDKTSYLYLSPPLFFKMKDFETGEKTSLYSPNSILLFTALMERYNYWKKGTQYFEIMIPLDKPVPVLRDKVEVRYAGDEYVSVMGRKVESEKFVLSSKGVPETKLHISKYTHVLLSGRTQANEWSFNITGFHRQFGKFINKLFGTMIDVHYGFGDGGENAERKVISQPEIMQNSEYVFFESDKNIMSGRLWYPKGEGPHPAVILIGDDGPASNSQEYVFQDLIRSLTLSGAAVLDFDGPGQGKSQGSFIETDDQRRVGAVRDATMFLKGHPSINGEKISFLGYKSGGYIALAAAEAVPGTLSCVVLNFPLEVNMETYGDLEKEGLGEFSEDYIDLAADLMGSEVHEIKSSDKSHLFFLRRKLSLKGCKGYLERKPLEIVARAGLPVLMIFGKDSFDYRPDLMEKLRPISEKNEKIKIAVIQVLGNYMGVVVSREDPMHFETNRDLLKLVDNWIRGGFTIDVYV